MESSLVVQTSFIGDVILTTPLIAALAERGPVDVVTTRIGATVLANNPAIRQLLVYDKRGADRGVRGLWRVAREVGRRDRSVTGHGGAGHEGGGSGAYPARRTCATPFAPHPAWPATMGVNTDAVQSHDSAPHRGVSEGVTQERRAGQATESPPHSLRSAYLAQGSARSAVLALAAGYGNRIGFNTSAGAWLYTEKVEYRDDWHHARRLLSLSGNITSDMIRPRVYPGPDEVVAVDGVLQERTRPFVVIAPGSVWATKRWPYYAELGRLLIEQFDVVVVGAKGDAQSLGDFVSNTRVIDATGKLSLLGSAELIGRAAAIVTNDSSPQHLASAMGTPTVTVFGPTVPEFGFGPLAEKARVVGNVGLECRPCDRHGPKRCPLGHWRCMRDVTARTVWEAVIHVIQ